MDDLAGSLHALLLITLALGTERLCRRFRVARVSMNRVVWALLSALLWSFFGLALSMHTCGEGTPWNQILIPGLCLLALGIFIEREALRVGSGLAMVVFQWGLAFHFSAIVHGPVYSGRESRPHLDASRPNGVVHTPNSEIWHTPLTGLYRRR